MGTAAGSASPVTRDWAWLLISAVISGSQSQSSGVYGVIEYRQELPRHLVLDRDVRLRDGGAIRLTPVSATRRVEPWPPDAPDSPRP